MFRNWLSENSGILFWLAAFGVFGAMLVAQPARMIRWTVSRLRERSDDPLVQRIARLIGLWMLCGVSYALVRMIFG
jgi:hypothetical protein